MKFLYFLVSFLAVTIARKGFGNTDQEWGFVELRPNTSLFWWLHYTTATSDPLTRPLVIWLQGGPGGSSTGFGNFQEIGPLDADLNERSTSWVKNVNLLFVDNPVGTGYSFVKDGGEYAKNNTQIAKDFLVFLKQFYEELPAFKDVPLYIFSESYGGKMTAEIALVLYQEAQKGNIADTLKGIGLGDSWISPDDSTLSWGPYLFNLGFVDENGLETISNAAQVIHETIEQGDYSLATDLWRELEGTIDNLGFGVDFYNVLTKIYIGRPSGRTTNKKPSLYQSDDDKVAALMEGAVKEALNIPDDVIWGENSGNVFTELEDDFMKPVTEIVEELLNKTDIKVVVYNGQLDLIVDTSGTVKWVSELKWEGASQWKTANRVPVAVHNLIEGYKKQLGNLSFYWINRAGHMVPADNTAAMEYILRETTNDYKV